MPFIPVRRLAGPALVATALALALPASASAATQTLTVSKAGTGTGTVVSFPAGINCGATCSAPFAEGSTVSLTAASGSPTLPVQWSGCDSVNVEGKCIVAMSGPRTVTATFNLEKHQLAVSKAGTGTGTVTSSPAGIECGTTCSAAYTHGTALTLSGSPGPNTEAATWTGCDSVNGEDKCLVTLNGAKTVKATFDSKPQLTVTKAGAGAASSTVTGSPGPISCGGTCQAFYDKGTLLTLTAHLPSGVLAPQWTGCGSEPSPTECKVTMSEAKTVSATFNLEAGFALYPVAVQKTGTGQGTVSGSPGQISCGAVCSGEYLTGTALTLTAFPSPGSVFAHWSGGGCSGSGACTTTIKAPKTVKAVFTAVGQRKLTVTKAGTGQGTVSSKAAGIDCGTSCSSQVPVGKKVTLSAKAATGSTFNHWSGACSGTAKSCAVTMSEAKSVTATFSAPQAAPSPQPTPTHKPKPRKCKRGFKKRKVHGKVKCVKIRKHGRHRAHRRRG